jgi:predicted ArsR family transcriptional regulator
MTVEELARALRLTNNAVRNQLRKLESATLVEQRGSRPGVSKPSALYSITLGGQVLFSTLYLPVLSEFLQVAEGQCAGKQLTSFMVSTGKSLARNYPKPSGALRERVHEAALLLRRFGGLTEVHKQNGSLVLRSKACPLAALTAENTTACRVIEGLLKEYVSAPARTCCETNPHPRCCFVIGGAGTSSSTRRRK